MITKLDLLRIARALPNPLLTPIPDEIHLDRIIEAVNANSVFGMGLWSSEELAMLITLEVCTRADAREISGCSTHAMIMAGETPDWYGKY